MQAQIVWQSTRVYACVCMWGACVHACVRTCVRAYVRTCVRVCAVYVVSIHVTFLFSRHIQRESAHSLHSFSELVPTENEW